MSIKKFSNQTTQTRYYTILFRKILNFNRTLPIKTKKVICLEPLDLFFHEMCKFSIPCFVALLRFSSRDQTFLDVPSGSNKTSNQKNVNGKRLKTPKIPNNNV